MGVHAYKDCIECSAVKASHRVSILPTEVTSNEVIDIQGELIM